MRFLVLLLIVNFSFIGVIHADSVEMITLQVKSYNRVMGGSAVYLSDIVETTSLNNNQILKQLGSVVLGDVPALGERRIYSNKIVAEAIRKNIKNKNWNIKIPHRVIVENRGHEISQELIEAQLLEKWKPSCHSDCEIIITQMQLPAVPPEFAQKKWNLEHDGRLPRGHVQAQIHYQHEDGRPVYFWLSAKTQIKRKVPVTTRSLTQNSRFQAEDIRWEWRDVTFATDMPAMGQEILGQQARFALQGGDVVWKNSVQREKAVRRGEVVRVFSGESAWEVAVQAITEQDGYVGDTVNVRNTSTNKVVSGRVVAAGEVEMR